MPGNARAGKAETTSGEKWRQGEARHDETPLHHSRPLRRHEATGSTGLKS